MRNRLTPEIKCNVHDRGIIAKIASGARIGVLALLATVALPACHHHDRDDHWRHPGPTGTPAPGPTGGSGGSGGRGGSGGSAPTDGAGSGQVDDPEPDCDPDTWLRYVIRLDGENYDTCKAKCLREGGRICADALNEHGQPISDTTPVQAGEFYCADPECEGEV